MNIKDKVNMLNSKGYLLTEIANELGISRNEVYNYLNPDIGYKCCTANEIKIIKNLRYDDKLPVSAIAKITGKCNTTIRRILNPKKRNKKHKEHIIDNKTLLLLIEDYETNQPMLVTLAKKYDMDPDSVKYRLVKAGVYKNQSNRLKQEEIDEIYKLHDMGVNNTDIALYLNRCRETIARQLAKRKNKDK